MSFMSDLKKYSESMCVCKVVCVFCNTKPCDSTLQCLVILRSNSTSRGLDGKTK